MFMGGAKSVSLVVSKSSSTITKLIYKFFNGLFVIKSTADVVCAGISNSQSI